MDFLIWGAVIGGAVLLGALLTYFAPAHTSIVLDTAAGTARADMRLLWGIGPLVSSRAMPKSQVGKPVMVFADSARIGHALMTPGLADAVFEAVRSLLRLNPKVARLDLGINLGDTAKNLVVRTAVEAAFAAAPARWRDVVSVRICEAAGAELSGRFDVAASPARLSAIWSNFRQSRAAREFRRRLKRAPKQSKRAPREVRAP